MSDALTSFARYIWPVLRHVASNPKRCARCITLLPGEERVCEQCRDESPLHITPATPLNINPDDKLLLLLSGGKDCLYLLGKLKRQYPSVDIEGVLVDTGFLGPSALKNAQNGAERTRTNIRVVRSYASTFCSVLRNAFLGLKDEPLASCYGTVDYAEGNLVFQIGIDIAKANGQRVVSGLTSSQLELIDAPIKNVPGSLFPLDAWRPSEEEILRGAHATAGRGSRFGPLETNSVLVPLMLILDILRLGYCGFEPEFARNVRTGLSNRKTWLYRFEALKWLAENGYLDSKMDKLLESLNLTRKDVLP